MPEVHVVDPITTGDHVVGPRCPKVDLCGDALAHVPRRRIVLPHDMPEHQVRRACQVLDVGLELTEGVAMDDPHGAIAVMNDLYNRGIRMSIDDFGTGYSSLSYLKQFKVYKLKIDQSFVRDVTEKADDKAIVAAIINMSRSLGFLTIAEGVETTEQLAFLREQGCNEVQGYHFSKPLPSEQFEAFVRNHKQH